MVGFRPVVPRPAPSRWICDAFLTAAVLWALPICPDLMPWGKHGLAPPTHSFMSMISGLICNAKKSTIVRSKLSWNWLALKVGPALRCAVVSSCRVLVCIALVFSTIECAQSSYEYCQVRIVEATFTL